ncbi:MULTISPECIES: TrkH family potassium uptake protein [unclassified Paenibacillus]|uniref:TrkH family potassium uptake protein n=1 Tax=unclassified Paenibacillus TaxID=185978 RepID=UPI0009568955|nr:MULTISPECIES: TrkH family potassium uptake protein [unclassified Paenibacillus]SIR57534.1 trk system potassium uptake protein TrkH [Paenibacillus sp. RU4X]SIR66186.1 trk system potassium uptake protein TrkH [Paenibacillus sp. RU4T]
MLSNRYIRSAYLTPPRVLAGGFLSLIVLGTILLATPAASADGVRIPVLDALFTATSATCVTGLTIMNTGTEYSLFGQIVLLVLFQLGGTGFMTAATWFALAFGRKISLRDRLVLKESLNQTEMSGIVQLVIRIFLFSAAIEGVGALLYTFIWMDSMPLSKAAYFGVFHAVSVFNNAGFEIIGGWSQFVSDPAINLITMTLIFFGSIGFIVMADLIRFPERRKISLHSKVVLWASVVLTLGGAILFFIFEFTNTRSFGDLGLNGKIWASFFQSFSLRSAGINTVPIEELRQATQLLMIILMFIGAAPGSTGGGIKLTTFVVLLAGIHAILRGREDAVIFRYRIAAKELYRAITVTLMGVIIIVASTMILTTVENASFLVLLFEAVSAFGTVGFSLGATLDLTPVGKGVIIILMFAGRLGLLTLAFAIRSKSKKEPFRYPEGRIIIG